MTTPYLNTVADLKRTIAVGMRLSMRYLDGGLSIRNEEFKKKIGDRTVSYIDSTGFYLRHATDDQTKKGSFCEWPKAKDFHGGHDVFQITNDFGTPYQQTREYTIIKK